LGRTAPNKALQQTTAAISFSRVYSLSARPPLLSLVVRHLRTRGCRKDEGRKLGVDPKCETTS